jgi:motility quorum-sensing regulator / GCU-specific mRNA interferase toxin
MMLPSNSPSRGTPAYDLELIQQMVGQGPISRLITSTAVEGARMAGLEQSGIVEAVLELTPSCFYKSMESDQRPGLWQDVYHLRYAGVDLYIKLQIDVDGFATVVQFKRR